MSTAIDRHWANGARFVRGMRGGHYESWFQRANHPMRDEAFWIRYTIFAPKGSPERAIAELWAVWFRGDEIVSAKRELPVVEARFASTGLEVAIGDATLSQPEDDGALVGSAGAISWDLRYTAPESPLLLLPKRLYGAALPKAKALVGSPLARFSGELRVREETIVVDDWVGSQNHNWGSKHTDEYAWGQVAGFDDAPDAFLELSTARVHLGPLKTPWLTPLVLRLDGEELRSSALVRAARNDGSYDEGMLRWRFAADAGSTRIEGEISADPERFVALPYGNPPGGTKTCLNSKVARCALRVSRGGESRTLTSAHRAAFEILTEGTSHPVTKHLEHVSR